MNTAHGHFSTGQSKEPHAPEEERTGHFSEGQEKAHDSIAARRGHFSEGQEKTHEDEPDIDQVGSFATTQRA